jgi:type IV secretion system protein TrbD
MTLRTSRVHKIAFRKPLIWGCDRRAIIVVAGVSLLLVWTQTWPAAAFAALIWPPALYYLRKLGEYDPLYLNGAERMWRVYRQPYYPPRSTPYRKNVPRRAKRYAPRTQRPLL